MARAVARQRLSGDGTVTVELRGELDLRAEDALRSLLVGLIEDRRPPRVVVDMRLVTFVDSTGLGALVAGSLAAMAKGTAFSVRDPAPFIERQLRLSGVYELLTEEAPPAAVDG